MFKHITPGRLAPHVLTSGNGYERLTDPSLERAILDAVDLARDVVDDDPSEPMTYVVWKAVPVASVTVHAGGGVSVERHVV